MFNLTVGAKKKLNLSDAGSAVTTLTYSSNKPGVASITSTGILTAVSPGVALITATNTVDTSTKSVVVEVVAAAVGIHSYHTYFTGLTLAINGFASLTTGDTTGGHTPTVSGTAAQTTFNNPQKICYNAKYNKIYLADRNGDIRSIDPVTGASTLVYHDPSNYPYSGIATDGADMLYIGYRQATGHEEVKKYNLATSTASVLANWAPTGAANDAYGMAVVGTKLYMGIFNEKTYSLDLTVTTPVPVAIATVPPAYSFCSHGGKLFFADESLVNQVQSYDPTNGVVNYYTFPGAIDLNQISYLVEDPVDQTLYAQAHNNTDGKDYIYALTGSPVAPTTIYSGTTLVNNRSIAIDNSKDLFELIATSGFVGLKKSN